MSDIKMCGVVLCALVLCVIFKGIKTEYSLFIRIGACILISLISFALFLPILSFIEKISTNTVIHEYIPTLIKILGISIAITLTCDVCKDAGEESLSNKLAFFGKIEILVLTMPIIEKIFEICKSLLN